LAVVSNQKLTLKTSKLAYIVWLVLNPACQIQFFHSFHFFSFLTVQV